MENFCGSSPMGVSATFLLYNHKHENVFVVQPACVRSRRRFNGIKSLERPYISTLKLWTCDRNAHRNCQPYWAFRLRLCGAMAISSSPSTLVLGLESSSLSLLTSSGQTHMRTALATVGVPQSSKKDSSSGQGQASPDEAETVAVQRTSRTRPRRRLVRSRSFSPREPPINRRQYRSASDSVP